MAQAVTGWRLAPLLLAAALFLPKPASAQDLTLQIPAVPSGGWFWSAERDDYTVRVRRPGGQWQDLYEYKVRVDSDTKSLATMVFFNSDGPVELSVRKNNGAVHQVSVRPSSRQVPVRIEGDIAYLTLAGPTKLSVEFDGDRLTNLHVFAGALRPEPQAGAGVRIFGPGVHEAGEDRLFHFASGETVYLAPGAILNGGVMIEGADDVRLIGNGLIYNAPDHGITINNSREVVIDGPTVVNPSHYSLSCGQSRGIEVADLKAFSEGSWTDGIDMMACSDVDIDDVFLRNSDDTIAIYAGRKGFTGDARNITVSNAVLWADIAHPIHLGIHGSVGGQETIEEVTFRNIDVLEHDENDRDYQGVMAINAGDNNIVRKVLFEDIRVDRVEEGLPFLLRVVFNEKYSHTPGLGISDVTLRNIQFPEIQDRRALIEGFAADREVSDVRLENVTIGDRPFTRDDLMIGDHVGAVTIR
ncbi:glycosyl hydrolase family 28 protein [Croceibacterium sp. TMG7-5b_MA50]|uniref:glycosyl hydrolase family 28 protein n=1 Tax=Croceibacterium sp. TMG7-5b_MA50 TaxID=3121290 RepID=UPI003221B580